MGTKKSTISKNRVFEKESGNGDGHVETDLIRIAKPKFAELIIDIEGISQYVQHKFSEKAKGQMAEDQEKGQRAKTVKRKREPKDFEALAKAAAHVSSDGAYGIPAAAFRNAMIEAGPLAGVFMTTLRSVLFVRAELIGDDGTDLVPITHGTPETRIVPVRLASGVIDLRARPHWAPGWKASVPVRFDAHQLGPEDVINLMARAGLQIGIGEGRPKSKKGGGCGWGMFRVLDKD